jgi:hypothetical protein
MSLYFGERLDALAEAVFGGTEGEGRVAPLLERFERLVGAPRVDDEDPEALHAIRVDWALCDAWIDGEPGDTWANRAARGLVPGVEPHADWALLAASVARVFEVWPGRPAMARDVVGGLVVPLADAVPELEETRGEPSALWEMRLVLEAEGGRSCRPAIDYPFEVLDELASLRVRFPVDPEKGLRALQRARLIWARSGRRSRLRLM